MSLVYWETGQWKETEGVLAKDIVRERHATIVSGTWQVVYKMQQMRLQRLP
jgi:Zn/Cd-binding protein ZinT